MVALNFSPEFADLVAGKKKKQTIRQTDRGLIAGKRIQLYTAQRTKQCRKLINIDPVCTKVVEIQIHKNSCWLGPYQINNQKMLKIAKSDGFESYQAMWAWFENKYKLTDKCFIQGYLIKWDWPE